MYYLSLFESNKLTDYKLTRKMIILSQEMNHKKGFNPPTSLTIINQVTWQVEFRQRHVNSKRKKENIIIRSTKPQMLPNITEIRLPKMS